MKRCHKWTDTRKCLKVQVMRFSVFSAVSLGTTSRNVQNLKMTSRNHVTWSVTAALQAAVCVSTSFILGKIDLAAFLSWCGNLCLSLSRICGVPVREKQVQTKQDHTPLQPIKEVGDNLHFTFILHILACETKSSMSIVRSLWEDRKKTWITLPFYMGS